MRDRTKLRRRLSGLLRQTAVCCVGALVAACAAPEQAAKPEAGEATVQKQVPVPTGAPVAAAPKSAPTPTIPLTQPTMYKVLVAELAVQRGQYETAVKNYLELARQIRDPQLAERAARIALFSKQPSKAVEAARLWVEIAPSDLEARQVLAAMLIRAGEVDPALVHLEYVLNHDSANAPEHLKKIVNFLGHEKDKRVALRVMERLVEQRQNNPDALFAYALLAMRADETAKARTAMEKLLQTGTTNNNMVVAYVGILQKQGETATALDWLDKALAKDPKNYELRTLYARLLADAKRYPDAREQFETVAKEQPENTDVQFALGLLSMQENQGEEAKKYFSGLTQREPYQNEASYYLGQIAESNKNYEEALRWYSAITQGEVQFDAQLSGAMVLAKMKRYDEANSRLAEVETKSPEQQTRLIRVRGELLTEQGNYQAAMDLYDKALADKYDPDLLYTRAMVAEKMGRVDILERDLKRVLSKDPDNAQALNALGFTLADQTNRHQEAYDLIKHALQLRPNDHYILDSMGWVLYRLGRLPEAATHLRRAKDLRNDPEIAAHLGEVLWKMGDRAGAREAWESGLHESPNDPKLIDVMQRLTR